MKTYQNTTMKLNIPVQVPDSVDEFNRLAGDPEACLLAAIRNVIYKTVNPQFRKLFVERLEAETGIERKSKITGEGDDAKTTYTETELSYYNRMLAEEHITEEAAQILANEVAPAVDFDPAPATRAKKAPKETVVLAQTVLAQIEDENHPRTAENFLPGLAAKMELESFEGSFGELTEDSLVAALVALKAYQAKQSELDLLG